VNASRSNSTGNGGKAEEQERQRHGRWDGELPGCGLGETTEHAVRPLKKTRYRGGATKQELEHEFEQSELFVGRWEELEEDVA
jgi:hypothetical protein